MKIWRASVTRANCISKHETYQSSTRDINEYQNRQKSEASAQKMCLEQMKAACVSPLMGV